MPDTEIPTPPRPTYCDVAPGHPWHGPYHEHEYGVPQRDDRVLFERLILEIQQAGLSWLTVLKKRAAFAAAFADWDLDAVAKFGPEDERRLLGDAGIIRNRLKIAASIENARRLVAIRDEYGSIAAWLDQFPPMSKAEWVRLFKSRFRFTGGEIVGEFLMSIGILPGAHAPNCPRYTEILDLDPVWARNRSE